MRGLSFRLVVSGVRGSRIQTHVSPRLEPIPMAPPRFLPAEGPAGSLGESGTASGLPAPWSAFFPHSLHATWMTPAGHIPGKTCG